MNKYTNDEIQALIKIYNKHGYIKYINNYDIEKEFFALTGKFRRSGTLYMAFWRYKQGKYDHLIRI